MKLGWIVAMTLCAAACGKKDGGGGGGGGESGEKLPANAVTDANAAIPKDLAGKLKFVESTFEERKAKALVLAPDGWKKSEVIPGSFSPPDNSNLGFMTKYSVGSNCDGTCEAKDWAATADKVEFAQLTGGGQFKVQKDEKGAGKRLVVASNEDGSVYVASAVWKDGESRYYSCRATLEKEIAAAAPAFEKACAALTPVW